MHTPQGPFAISRNDGVCGGGGGDEGRKQVAAYTGLSIECSGPAPRGTRRRGGSGHIFLAVLYLTSANIYVFFLAFHSALSFARAGMNKKRSTTNDHAAAVANESLQSC